MTLRHILSGTNFEKREKKSIREIISSRWEMMEETRYVIRNGEVLRKMKFEIRTMINQSKKRITSRGRPLNSSSLSFPRV